MLRPFITFRQKTQSKIVNNIYYAKQMTHQVIICKVLDLRTETFQLLEQNAFA